MSINEKNRFSTLLEELISISGVKNSGLAKALQYDASYISKWVSGRLLPTEKTKKKRTDINITQQKKKKKNKTKKKKKKKKIKKTKTNKEE